jgi:hypothetical protein
MNTAEIRARLNHLLHINVLHRGLIVPCSECERRTFYRIELLGERNTCPRCGAPAYATAARRSQQGEPEWFYDLHGAVRELLEQNGDVPFLAGMTRTYGMIPRMSYWQQHDHWTRALDALLRLSENSTISRTDDPAGRTPQIVPADLSSPLPRCPASPGRTRPWPSLDRGFRDGRKQVRSLHHLTARDRNLPGEMRAARRYARSPGVCRCHLNDADLGDLRLDLAEWPGGIGLPCDAPTAAGTRPRRSGPSGAFGAELAEEASVVGPHELLDEPSAVIEPEHVHEVPDGPCPVRLELSRG